MFDTLLEILYLYAGIMAGVFLFLIIKWRVNRDKMMIRILTESGPRIYLRSVDPEGNSVYILKPSKKGLGWNVKFSQTYPVRTGFLGMTRRNCIDVYPGSIEAITRNYRDKTEDAPTFNRTQANEIFRAGVIKASGQTGQKLEIPILFYVFMFAILIFSLMTFLAASGIIHFGVPG